MFCALNMFQAKVLVVLRNLAILNIVPLLINGHPGLLVFKTATGREEVVPSVLTVRNGSSFSLSCKIVNERNESYSLQDGNVLWSKKSNRFLSGNGFSRLAEEESNTSNASHPAELTFNPVNWHDQGVYSCTNVKDKLFKRIHLLVRYGESGKMLPIKSRVKRAQISDRNRESAHFLIDPFNSTGDFKGDPEENVNPIDSFMHNTVFDHLHELRSVSSKLPETTRDFESNDLSSKDLPTDHPALANNPVHSLQEKIDSDDPFTSDEFSDKLSKNETSIFDLLPLLGGHQSNRDFIPSSSYHPTSMKDSGSNVNNQQGNTDFYDQLSKWDLSDQNYYKPHDHYGSPSDSNPTYERSPSKHNDNTYIVHTERPPNTTGSWSRKKYMSPVVGAGIILIIILAARRRSRNASQSVPPSNSACTHICSQNCRRSGGCMLESFNSSARLPEIRIPAGENCGTNTLTSLIAPGSDARHRTAVDYSDALPSYDNSTRNLVHGSDNAPSVSMNSPYDLPPSYNEAVGNQAPNVPLDAGPPLAPPYSAVTEGRK